MWRRFLVLVVGILPAATAQTCTPDRGYYGYAYIVNAQSDLDTIASKCTTVNGSVVIGTNYTGSFSLPHVQNLTGEFRWESNLANTTPAPTSVDLPDLEFVGSSLDLQGLSSLLSFSAPKLKTVGWSVDMDYVRTVNLTSLEQAEYVQIVGNLTGLQLDSLKHVRANCDICNKFGCDQTETSSTSFDLSLPSLQTVGAAMIIGQLSSFDAPKLSNITGVGLTYYALQLVTAGKAINVSFPELRSVASSIDFEGDITGLSMPEVKDSTGSLTVRSYVPLDINLPLEEADDISLSGNISSVQFPNLKSLSILTIESDLRLDCDSIEKSLAAANTTKTTMYCTSGKKNSAPGLVVDAKAAIGVAVGVVGMLFTL
ncbi:conserved hypothetical protein [Paecilomyces variotii No. 5]|uniref:GPI-anchored cell wall organization protein Ecm33 n=1 Tax=Byssochlamys spectabilis (strain No. 5 / NBRC 109023) TaxID=1356009 RepID=V5FKI6_BYSSN|nr:conserved hypothetical protein [Paecilomyces variotii No. 5]